jgi:hypothetical protein
MPDSITPPSELIEQWMQAHSTKYDLARHAAQWGADQELEACCRWTAIVGGAEALRAARRPNPPSLKEQALNDLDTIQTHDSFGFQIIDLSNIRRALEALDA